MKIIALAIALYLATPVLAMDFFDYDAEPQSPEATISLTQSNLELISHINPLLFTEFARQHPCSKTTRLCTGLRAKLEVLKTQYLSTAALLHSLSKSIPGEASEFTTTDHTPEDVVFRAHDTSWIEDIIENLEPLQDINPDQFKTFSIQEKDSERIQLYTDLCTELTAIKEDCFSILQELNKLSDILESPSKSRERAGSVAIIQNPGRSSTKTPEHDDTGEFYVGSYNPRRKNALLDSPH